MMIVMVMIMIVTVTVMMTSSQRCFLNMSLLQYAWIMSDDYGHDIMMAMPIIMIVTVNNDDFITEMFLGHVASLHTLGGDGFATQFEQVTKFDEIFLTEMRKKNKNKLTSLEVANPSSKLSKYP